MKQLIKVTHKRLAEVADARRAPEMQRYMKSAMPFLGVPTPQRRAVTKEVWKEFEPADAQIWREQIAAIWDHANFREQRYAAIDWCRYAWPANRQRKRERFGFHTMEVLALFERLITQGAWWDLVDDLGGHQIGVLLNKYPNQMNPLLEQWARSDNLWRRRAAIICQLDFKDKTDTQLLRACMEPSFAPSPFSREFFIQKGMGWALRQYARFNPGWVREYLVENQSRLSALTRREAGKHLRA